MSGLPFLSPRAYPTPTGSTYDQIEVSRIWFDLPEFEKHPDEDSPIEKERDEVVNNLAGRFVEVRHSALVLSGQILATMTFEEAEEILQPDDPGQIATHAERFATSALEKDTLYLQAKVKDDNLRWPFNIVGFAKAKFRDPGGFDAYIEALDRIESTDDPFERERLERQIRGVVSLEGVYVEEPIQRQGTGSALIDYALAHFPDNLRVVSADFTEINPLFTPCFDDYMFELKRIKEDGSFLDKLPTPIYEYKGTTVRALTRMLHRRHEELDNYVDLAA